MYTNIINLLSESSRNKVNELFNQMKNEKVWCISKTTATGKDGKVSAAKYTFGEACEALKKTRKGGYVARKGYDYNPIFTLNEYGVSEFDITAPYRDEVAEINEITISAAFYQRNYTITWRDDKFDCEWHDSNIRYFWKDEKSGTIYELKLKLYKDELIRNMYLAVKDANCSLIDEYNNKLRRLNRERDFTTNTGEVIKYVSYEIVGVISSEKDIPSHTIHYFLKDGSYMNIDNGLFIFKKTDEHSMPEFFFIGDYE